MCCVGTNEFGTDEENQRNQNDISEILLFEEESEHEEEEAPCDVLGDGLSSKVNRVPSFFYP